MLKNWENGPPRGAARILCLGAHCDDIEIGCGGTIMSWLAANASLHVDWVIFSSGPKREREARASASHFLAAAASSQVQVKDFRNGYFPYVGDQIKDYFESLKGSLSPDIVLTHFGGDLHQDHRCVSELTWNTFRNHLILEYEIPKYDGGMGSPNVFVELSKETAQSKIDALLDNYETQRDKAWFDSETFYGLMRLRGVECHADEGLAEAFYCRKMLL